jgi:large subunit ribosomal protein L6
VSRIGRKLIKLTDKVEVKIENGVIYVKGPKGNLSKAITSGFELKIENNNVEVINNSKEKDNRAKHGLYRSLINNMVIGVSEGYKKELELVGVGYRVQLEGKKLSFTLGYSHPINIPSIDGISFEVEGQNKIKVSGIDKELVGQVAADIRSLRPPCAYKGKGVKYADEIIKKKQGKSVKK